MNLINILGIIAGLLTTTSLIPQVLKLLKTKSGEDISPWMFIIFSSGVCAWLIYGILISNIPIIVANTATFILCMMVLGLRYKYHRASK